MTFSVSLSHWIDGLPPCAPLAFALIVAEGKLAPLLPEQSVQISKCGRKERVTVTSRDVKK